jgi:hypothetical protein
MSKRVFIIAIFLSLLCFNFNINAQPFKQFSGDPNKFTEEVFSFFGKIQEDSIQKNMNEFYVSWDSSKLNTGEKELILSFSKCFIDKKARSTPDFYRFVCLINVFLKSSQSRESFLSWLAALNQTCAIRKTSLSTINRLILNTSLLIKGNKLYESTPPVS